MLLLVADLGGNKVWYGRSVRAVELEMPIAVANAGEALIVKVDDVLSGICGGV